MLLRSILIAALCLLVGPTVQAQEREEGEEGFRRGRRERGERRAEDPERQERRREMRQRWERAREGGTEGRREWRNDHLTDIATSTYDLDESQKAMARAEIVAAEEERRAAMGTTALEYDQLRQEMGDYWRRVRDRSAESGDRGDRGDRDRRRGGRDRGEFWRRAQEDPGFQRIRERMREIEREFPNDFETALKRIEEKLPEEQAKKGRERRAQRRSRRGGMGGMGRRNGDGRRDAGRDRGDRGERFGRGRGGDRRAQRDGRRRSGRGTDFSRRRADAERRGGDRSNEQTRPPRTLHPWEKYVQDFNASHELTAAQVASSESILKDVRRRAQLVEKRNATSLAEAKRMRDRTQRTQRLAELNKPVDQLFEELKKRLNGLLTAAQRSKTKP